MSATYGLHKVLNDGLVVIDRNADRALWSHRRLRKRSRCAVSGENLEAGSQAFGPVGNQQYRAERIDARIIAEVVAALQEEELAAKRERLVCHWMGCRTQEGRWLTWGDVPLGRFFCADHEHEFMRRLGQEHERDNMAEARAGYLSFCAEAGREPDRWWEGRP